MERVNENSLKMRKNFVENYNQYLNNALSKTLMELKESTLNVKNSLVSKLTNSVFDLIKEKIQKDYPKYINFLLESIKKYKPYIDKPPKIVILFNSRDYDFFNKNPKKISSILENKVEIKKHANEFIGGFKIMRSEGLTSYDYSIDNIIDKNSTFIQSEFSKTFNDSEIKDLGKGFEKSIQNQKLGIEICLKDYDRI